MAWSIVNGLSTLKATQHLHWDILKTSSQSLNKKHNHVKNKTWSFLASIFLYVSPSWRLWASTPSSYGEDHINVMLFCMDPDCLMTFNLSFLTSETQRSSALFSLSWARPLLSESKRTFPKWRTLATVPNKCCKQWRICNSMLKKIKKEGWLIKRASNLH